MPVLVKPDLSMAFYSGIVLQSKHNEVVHFSSYLRWSYLCIISVEIVAHLHNVGVKMVRCLFLAHFIY